MTDYRPVDCTVHSKYELLIMQRRRILLTRFDNDAAPRTEVVTPTNLVTRQGEEFMVDRLAGGQVGNIRLDRIISYHHA